MWPLLPRHFNIYHPRRAAANVPQIDAFDEWHPVPVREVLRRAFLPKELVQSLVEGVATGAIDESFGALLDPYAETALHEVLRVAIAYNWMAPARALLLLERLGAPLTASAPPPVHPALLIPRFRSLLLSVAQLLAHCPVPSAPSPAAVAAAGEFADPAADVDLAFETPTSGVNFTTAYAEALAGLRETVAATPGALAAFDGRVARLVTRLANAIKVKDAAAAATALLVSTRVSAPQLMVRPPAPASARQPFAPFQGALAAAVQWALHGAPETGAACSALLSEGGAGLSINAALAPLWLSAGPLLHRDDVPMGAALHRRVDRTRGDPPLALCAAGRDLRARAVQRTLAALWPAHRRALIDVSLAPGLFQSACATGDSALIASVVAAVRALEPQRPLAALSPTALPSAALPSAALCAHRGYCALLAGTASPFAPLTAEDVTAALDQLLMLFPASEIATHSCRGCSALQPHEHVARTPLIPLEHLELVTTTRGCDVYEHLFPGAPTLMCDWAFVFAQWAPAEGFFLRLSAPRQRAWLAVLQRGARAGLLSAPALRDALASSRNATSENSIRGLRVNDGANVLELSRLKWSHTPDAVERDNPVEGETVEEFVLRVATNWPACVQSDRGEMHPLPVDAATLRSGLAAVWKFFRTLDEESRKQE